MDSFIPTVLIVDDSAPLRLLYSTYLKDENVNVYSVSSGRDAIDFISSHRPDVIFLDLYLPDISGFEVLNYVKKQNLDARVIMLTGSGSVDDAVEAMRLGAFDFIVKPIDSARLRVTLRNTTQHLKLKQMVSEFQTSQDVFLGFIGSSPAMKSVYSTIERAAPSSATVFITGESGTGKEVCAEAIHKLSKQKKGSFVPINCAAIPRDLMESELFGHVKGAFTGAVSDKIGAVQRADGGTLFLDEICELDPQLQSKLLRFIQTGKFYRVGSSKLETVSTRIVCATNKDPKLEVRAHHFREDLYYRLYVIPIKLPPLRDRDDDVERIATRFLKNFSQEENKGFTRFSISARQLLMAYDWPGNVRELQNVIHQIVVLNDGDEVTDEMFPESIRKDVLKGGDGSSGAQPQRAVISVGNPYAGKTLAEIERDAIEKTIDSCEGNISKAAKMLGVNQSTIHRKLRSWRDEAQGKSAGVAESGTPEKNTACSGGAPWELPDNKIRITDRHSRRHDNGMVEYD